MAFVIDVLALEIVMNNRLTEGVEKSVTVVTTKWALKLVLLLGASGGDGER